METQDDSRLLTRRMALRGSAAVAGAVWLAPVVTVVSMDSASAASAPPPDPDAGGETLAGHVEGHNRLGDSRAAVPGTSSNSALAFTGSNTAQAAAAGIVTIVVGAAGVTAAHRLRSRTEQPGPD